ncbi:MAG: short-chain dehydrogenase, partial [SAR324 cluster bacterium]|nr:short-chain dehydrogenase [SAR324 cluster bacterium]
MLGAKSDIAAATARLYAEKSCALTLAAREIISLEKIKEDLLIRGAVNVELAEVNLESVKSIKTFLKNLDPLPDLVI